MKYKFAIARIKEAEMETRPPEFVAAVALMDKHFPNWRDNIYFQFWLAELKQYPVCSICRQPGIYHNHACE